MTSVDLIHADAAALPIPDGSVDMVFTSPPYEDARTYGLPTAAAGEAWVRWAVGAFREHLRVCRGLVCWVVEGRTRGFRWSATPAMFMADLHRAGVHLRKPPAYRRNGIPGSGGPDWLRNDYEFVVCATARGGRLPWSCNTAMGHPPVCPPGGHPTYRTADGTRVNGTRCTDRRPSGQTVPRIYHPPALANPGNVIDCGAVGGGNIGSKLAHRNEAPFPEGLAEFFIRSFCPPGGTVLDPFCGSGTTLAVALRNGRNAIGADIRESQIALSAERVAEAERAMKGLP
jgi:hypothetical protein